MRVAIRAFNAHLLQQRGEAVPAPAPEAEAAPPPAGGTGPMMTRMRGAMVPRAGDRAAGAKTVSRGEEIEESSPNPEQPPKRTKLSGRGMQRALGGGPPARSLYVQSQSDVLGNPRQMRSKKPN